MTADVKEGADFTIYAADEDQRFSANLVQKVVPVIRNAAHVIHEERVPEEDLVHFPFIDFG